MQRFPKRRFLLGAAAGLLSTPALVRQASAQNARDIALPGDIVAQDWNTVTRVRTARPVVALTFDDGPHRRLTPMLLDILAARDVKATFYVIGNRVRNHTAEMERIVAEGHEIGNHTWSHPNLARMSDTGVLGQIDSTSRAIFDTVGRPPVTMRPPYGAFTGRQRAMLHQARNLPTVLWSVDPQDWRRPGSATVARRIITASHPGAVILAHDIQSGTVRAMPETIDALKARGYEFTTVSELLGWPNWSQRNLRLVAQN